MSEILSRLKKHYLPLTTLILISGLFFYNNRGNRDAITLIAQASGYISLVILTFSLLIGPANLILKKKNPVSTYFRRDLSITGGILAVVHSITGLFVHLRGNTWQYFLIKNEQGYAIRLDKFGLANYTGLISTIIILLLLITSNDFLLRKLNPSRWKNIQRFSYLMFILTIFHCFFYRIGKDNHNPIFWFYIPIIVIVLTFQTIGITLKLKKQSE